MIAITIDKGIDKPNIINPSIILLLSKYKEQKYNHNIVNIIVKNCELLYSTSISSPMLFYILLNSYCMLKQGIDG